MTKYKFMKSPVYKWKFSLCENTYWYVENAPNVFHRFMQRLLLGITWEKQ